MQLHSGGSGSLPDPTVPDGLAQSLGQLIFDLWAARSAWRNAAVMSQSVASPPSQMGKRVTGSNTDSVSLSSIDRHWRHPVPQSRQRKYI